MKQKPLAVFDVDGTQFKSACVEKVADEAIRQGLFNGELFGKARAQRRLWQENNNEGVYQAYLHNLVGAFVASISGVKVEHFRDITEQMVAEHRVRLFSYTRQLGQLLKPSHRLIAISGSPLPVVEPFLEGSDFDEIYGSTFEVENGRYTGEAKSISKAAAVETLLADGAVLNVGIGDTIGDLPVLSQATCPIAFNPSDTLRKQAVRHGWFIAMEQKDAITQLVPQNGSYQAHFERSPKIILDAAGIT